MGPRNAVAVGLFLLGILALAEGRTGRSVWLFGAAIAVQPLVLLALPIVAMVIEPRRLAGFLPRAAAPGVVLLAAGLYCQSSLTSAILSRIRRAAGLSQVAGPARREGQACPVSPPLLLAPVPPLAGEPRRGRAQHVPGELPLAGQQPFRQLGPPGITAARHRAKPRFVIPRASVTAAAATVRPRRQRHKPVR